MKPTNKSLAIFYSRNSNIATVKGVRGMVQYGFWPFLVLHFVVRFSPNHNRTAPYFYGHMCDAVQCGVA